MRHLSITADKLEVRTVELFHHRAGLSYTASGYGARIPSRRQVRMPGDKRWRRVYVAQFGNSGTAYIRVRGEVVAIDD